MPGYSNTKEDVQRRLAAHRRPGPRPPAHGRRGRVLHRRAHADLGGHQGAASRRARVARRPPEHVRRRRHRRGRARPRRTRSRRRRRRWRGSSGRERDADDAHLIAFVSLADIGDSLREAFFMFWETLWALILGFALSGAVQAFVSKDADAARARRPPARRRSRARRASGWCRRAARTRRRRWRSRCSRRAPTSSPRWCSCSRRRTWWSSSGSC